LGSPFNVQGYKGIKPQFFAVRFWPTEQSPNGGSGKHRWILYNPLQVGSLALLNLEP
jgi:hypothetical protein